MEAVSRSLGHVVEKFKRNHYTAALWQTTVRLSRLTFTEALLLRIAYTVALATLLFYEVIDILLRLMSWP
jgi:hypothetical protein